MTAPSSKSPRFKRILLKLSGEALMGDGKYGISPRTLQQIAEVILKATKVDGIYSADPMKDPTATRYKALSYIDVLKKNLKVMDSTAISLCMDNELPIIVFDLGQRGNILRVVRGEDVGTLVGTLKPQQQEA